MAAAGISQPNPPAMEYPNWTRIEGCDKEQNEKSSHIQRRSRKQRTGSCRQRKHSVGASVIRVFESRRQNESEKNDGQGETEKAMAGPKSIQMPFTNQRTNSKCSLLALTALITMAIPAVSADGMQEVQVPHNAEFTAEPIPPPNNRGFPITPASTSNVPPAPGYSGSPGNDNNEHNDMPHTNGTTTLIVVGSIVIALAFLIWLVWRISKRRRGIANTRDHRSPPFSTDTPSAKRRLLITKTLCRIPILKGHINDTDSGWTNLDHPYVGSSSEGTAPAASSLSGTQQQPGQAPAIVVHTEIVRKSFHASQEQNQVQLQGPEQQSVSTIDVQHTNALDPGEQPRKSCLSDNSSLSSGFGDGQFMMNSNNNNNSKNDSSNSNSNSNSNSHNSSSNMLNGVYQTNNPAAVVTTINAPSFPAAAYRDSASIRSERGRRRDTLCTEASEDQPPRFRTVHSWVKQQSNRIARAKQRVRSPSASEASTTRVPTVPPA
ncbi:hypothetical protein E4U43_008241 [Claviceps pusilla]|uniref:Uncharacterized protein n=1 Tax=Claviceps pusilla TaxID=123648 RepID=A0A9P7SYE7_9HYPO|nr:hypothetical protein E4U43_008241 [Claviceps pusilla]